MAKIITTLDTLKIANTFASVEATRPQICGVYIEPYGHNSIKLVATNGYVILCALPEINYRLVEGIFKPFLLPSEALKKLSVKTKRNQTSWAAIDTDEKTISIEACTFAIDSGDLFAFIKREGQTIRYTPEEIAFADYKRPIPPEKDYGAIASASFNPSLLGKFEKVSHCVRFYWNKDSAAPVVARAKHDHFEAFGIIMPMRYVPCQDSVVVPNWVKSDGMEPLADEGDDLV